MTKQELLNLKEKDEFWYYCTKAQDIQKCVVYNIVHQNRDSRDNKIIGKNMDLDILVPVLEDNFVLVHHNFKSALKFIIKVTDVGTKRYNKMFENYAKDYPELFI